MTGLDRIFCLAHGHRHPIRLTLGIGEYMASTYFQSLPQRYLGVKITVLMTQQLHSDLMSSTLIPILYKAKLRPKQNPTENSITLIRTKKSHPRDPEKLDSPSPPILFLFLNQTLLRLPNVERALCKASACPSLPFSTIAFNSLFSFSREALSAANWATCASRSSVKSAR